MDTPEFTITMPSVLTISDFTTANFTALLLNDEAGPKLAAVDAPPGQPQQLLGDPAHAVWNERWNCLIVWTQPHRVISGFARSLEQENVSSDVVLADVDQFVDLLNSCRNRASTILVPTWTLPPWETGGGLLAMRRDGGRAHLLAQMNVRLAERLGAPTSTPSDSSSRGGNIHVLDAQRWITAGGARAFSPKAWYLGKIPFSTDVFKQAVADVKSALRAIDGQERKLIILDLDDTLWGGLVGEVSWENLTLGGHDGEGEALVDFQKAIRALSRRGILLGIVSKNDEATALAALHEHPEMVLRAADFAGWRINWEDKARNIAELAAELNLGLQSVVFIDDSPAERARVRDALPEVLVPEWPADKTQYRKALLELTCFDAPSLTEEDRNRGAMYAADHQRQDALRSIGSVDDWLNTLRVAVQIERLHEKNLARAAQLLNKTNQMNLATRRLTESELMNWALTPGHNTWTFRVSDKFGELGLTGLLSVATSAEPEGDDAPRDGSAGGSAQIVDFVLSCRVMGRKVEETMVATAVRHAGEHGSAQLRAVYLPTPKNKPCLEFFRRVGFREEPAHSFAWDASCEFPFPGQVSVQTAANETVAR